jgi:hypothetical protein
MDNESIPEIPSALALLLIARQRFDDLNRLVTQTANVLNMYIRLINDSVSCIQEMPDDSELVGQLEELLTAARAYAAHHQTFTEKLDVETSFRRDGGQRFYECMVTTISDRQHLQEVVREAEKRYVGVVGGRVR